MKRRTLTRISLLMGVSVGMVVPTAGWADCGSIPYSSPLELMGGMTILKTENGVSDVRFNPMDVVIFEPGQRAIILWNGQEEILLLSTDIKTNQAVSLLEVIPLPAEPSVRLGEFEWFMSMQELLIDKAMWRVASGGGVPGARAPSRAAEITFSKKMGVHDVSVAHVLDRDGFVGWVEQFMTVKKAVNPKLDPGFARIIGNYLDRGTQWFVFDTLQTGNQLQSRQPVEYRFKTDHLYYPLEISSRESGKTNIDLLVVTTQPLTSYPKMRFAVKKESGVTITHEELAKAVPAWSGFMGTAPLTMQRIRMRGDLQKMTVDFVAR